MDAKRLSAVKTATLCMQRYSWEQGVVAQAFLELNEMDIVVAMAREAANRADKYAARP